MPSNIPWPLEREQLLRDCIAQKMSAGKTADFMGITPGAANGKAHRMGLRFLSVPGHPGKRKERPRKERIRNRNPSNQTRFLVKSYARDPGLKEVDVKPAEYLGIPLRDLASDQCHFIAGDDRLYCGQPTNGESDYCGWHKKIMYQPLQQRSGRLSLVPMNGRSN